MAMQRQIRRQKRTVVKLTPEQRAAKKAAADKAATAAQKKVDAAKLKSAKPVPKSTPKMTPQDAAMLKILKRKYGSSVYGG
jgi:hypothetical protein